MLRSRCVKRFHSLQFSALHVSRPCVEVALCQNDSPQFFKITCKPTLWRVALYLWFYSFSTSSITWMLSPVWSVISCLSYWDDFSFPSHMLAGRSRVASDGFIANQFSFSSNLVFFVCESSSLMLAGRAGGPLSFIYWFYFISFAAVIIASQWTLLHRWFYYYASIHMFLITCQPTVHQNDFISIYIRGSLGIRMIFYTMHLLLYIRPGSYQNYFIRIYITFRGLVLHRNVFIHTMFLS